MDGFRLIDRQSGHQARAIKVVPNRRDGVQKKRTPPWLADSNRGQRRLGRESVICRLDRLGQLLGLEAETEAVR